MEDDHSKGESGASDTFPKQCSALRKGEHVVIKNHPCKIVEMSTSKTGKHGHAKVHMIALDIFTQKKCEDICPSTHNMTCPNVKRTEYQCIGMNEDKYITLLDDNGETREDLKVDDNDQYEDLTKLLDDDGTCQVVVLKAMGNEQVMSVKGATK